MARLSNETLSRAKARVPAIDNTPSPKGSFREAELERYARHIILREIGGPGQKKLKTAKVLVIGAGLAGIMTSPFPNRRAGGRCRHTGPSRFSALQILADAVLTNGYRRRVASFPRRQAATRDRPLPHVWCGYGPRPAGKDARVQTTCRQWRYLWRPRQF